MADGEDRLRELVAQVAASYFSNSQVSPLEISSVMSQIAASLAAVSANDADPIDPPMAAVRATTAQVRKSITHEALIRHWDKLRAWIDEHRAVWPQLVTSIANKWLEEGLHDRGITRDVEWGVPVPDDIADGRLKGKVFYVWFDAPIEYIGVTKEWADANGKGDAWRDWWEGPKAKDVAYYELMGKDNVPFHTVGFPVTLMGSRPQEDWKLVDRLKCRGNDVRRHAERHAQPLGRL